MKAQLALLKQQLADAELKAPIGGIVRSRLLEPGEIASPQRPVLSLAIVDPKWVRAYVSEPDLTKVRPDMAATVTVDGEAGHDFTGHIGFISPVSRVHAAFDPDRGAAHQSRLRGARPGRRSGRCAAAGQPATVHLIPRRRAEMTSAEPAIAGRDIRKQFKRASGEIVAALDDVSLMSSMAG